MHNECINNQLIVKCYPSNKIRLYNHDVNHNANIDHKTKHNSAEQVSTQFIIPSITPVHLISPSLSSFVYNKCLAFLDMICFLFFPSATRGQTEDSYKKDFKYVIFDKENVVANKDTEVLILAKDSGKQFTSSGIHLGSGQYLAAPLWTDLK